MTADVKKIINSAVLQIIENTGETSKLNKLKKTHDSKIHFIPKKYRVLGGLLQSMNIQFGNFIELLMEFLIKNEDKYEIIEEYSGKKSNSFKLSKENDSLIDSYITKCQYGDIDLEIEFQALLNAVIKDKSTSIHIFKHDIDLLFRDKTTNVIYYLESKYNDDHDTGKFVDINRKFIKTYAYLVRELNIKSTKELVPILFFFTNKKMKGNIYVPERTNIRRGEKFFNEFLSVKYSDVNDYMSSLSESDEIVEMFNELYKKVMEI